MAHNILYIGVGEEAIRGTEESSTVSFIPVLSPVIPVMEFEDKKRKEFRGEDTVKGDRSVRRMSRLWTATLEIPFFTEGGTVTKGIGLFLKHFYGYVSTDGPKSALAYSHMFSPVADPFATANLGTKALTINCNINEGTVNKNWAYWGGRVSSISIEVEPGEPVKLVVEMMGQGRSPAAAEIGSPVFPAENLRGDYNNCKLYTGTVGRTGVGPDFTAFDFSGATLIKPDSLTLKIENGMEDVLRLAGVDYPDKTRLGIYTGTLELTIDWEDPASGFSSVDEFTAWLDSVTYQNFGIEIDTGTEIESGFNQLLAIDIPRCIRTGSNPEYDLENDPMITLGYDLLFEESVTKYLAGMFLQNSASTM